MTKRELLREAEEADRKEREEAARIEAGSGSDSMCSYYRRTAQHLRYLAAEAEDE